jgi:phosphoribosylformimino-5-aminoimidazole carboxamide ribotide isomerase
MKLLPVLDLLDGMVVHAKGGRRDGYLPLVSLLSFHSSPLGIVAGLLRLHPFQHLYIADLDAIMRQGDNRQAIAAITRDYPDLELWVDAGAASHEAIIQLLVLGVARPVVGTETLPDLETWQVLQASPWAERLVLSLDYRNGRFLGPLGLDQQPALWSRTIIVMSLDQVGSRGGPDWILLEQLRRKRPLGGELLAAGGVHCVEDLKQLAAWGADGVLLASALHDGILSAVGVEEIL